jgi:iron(II)-dependent oxidoreductase
MPLLPETLVTAPEILGRLASIHELTAHLVQSLPPSDVNRQFHSELGSLGWYFGRSVYQETYWLREVLQGDDDLTRRVRHLFTPGGMSLADQCVSLPPPDHLLNWAAEIRDAHLTWLANPALLPGHPLLADDRLAHFLVQEQALTYESMLWVLQERAITEATPDYRPAQTLEARAPSLETGVVEQGHYRVGSRFEPWAYDNELPPQAIELSAFRIALRPVSNAEWLAFMQSGGYEERSLWSAEGLSWLAGEPRRHPRYWRTDPTGRWYGLGVSGPADLPPQDVVTGICHHEARAFAAWASSLGDALAGATLQHEVQWETAARTGVLGEMGRAWEWCANRFEPYEGYQSPAHEGLATADFDGQHVSLRAGCLHTQPALRRASFRNRALPHQDYRFTGLRLIFPPGEPAW